MNKGADKSTSPTRDSRIIFKRMFSVTDSTKLRNSGRLKRNSLYNYVHII